MFPVRSREVSARIWRWKRSSGQFASVLARLRGASAVYGQPCCYGGRVGPMTATPSPRSLCSFSHSWARCVLSCVTRATSKLLLHGTHFIRLEVERTGRGSPAHPCSPSLAFYHHPFPTACPTDFQLYHQTWRQPLRDCLTSCHTWEGQSPVMNSTYRWDRYMDRQADRQIDGLYTPSGSASLNEPSYT